MKPRRPRHTVVTMRWPERYFTGLSPAWRRARENELLKRWREKNPKLGPSNFKAKLTKESRIITIAITNENQQVVRKLLKLENKNVLSRINKLVFGNSLFIHVNDTHCSINIGDKAYSNYKNLDVTDFDQLLSDSLFRHFVRGFIESNAYINDKPFAKFSSKWTGL